MINLLLVMIGGGLGCGCRYGISLLAVRLLGERFSWGTLAVNLAGCLLIGLAFGLLEKGGAFNQAFRLWFVVGFLGGLTTFSTFAWESLGAFTAGAPALGMAGILANNLGGLALVMLGLYLARTF